MTSPSRSDTLLIVGAGLIGTSIGLAARIAGWAVQIVDVDPARQHQAADRLAALDRGLPSVGAGGDPNLVCVAVPPAATPLVVQAALDKYVDATVMDTSSVKAEPLTQIEASGSDSSRYVGSHPLAGSERNGPYAARTDLFTGRSWVICPAPGTAPDRQRVVERLVADCQAHGVLLDAFTHDRLLAVTSHVPQLLASALATLVEDAFGTPAGTTAFPVRRDITANRGAASDGAGPLSARGLAAASLSGPALLDMTRIAASPSEMWAEIAEANSAPIRTAVGALIERLERLHQAMSAPPATASAVRDLVDEGRAARHSMGFKHAGAPAEAGVGATRDASDWIWVDAVVDDTPGTLARVFAVAARIGVNVEDVRVDHAPYAAAGLVSVAVRSVSEAQRLSAALQSDPTES